MDRRFLTSGPEPHRAPTAPGKASEARDVSDRFEVFVSERSLGWLPRIRPESELPYPKPTIQAALRAARASARDDAERDRWTACLVELEYFVPDRELEPYWAALEHERECIRLMGRANLQHRLDRPNGLTPELRASYERHVAGAAALRPLRDTIAAAAQRVAKELSPWPAKSAKVDNIA
jgi:hypothetical protein